jgi:hypothetical protein
VPEGFDQLLLSPSDSDYEDLQLTGFAKATFDELVNRTKLNDADSETVKDALVLLYRIAKGTD